MDEKTLLQLGIFNNFAAKFISYQNAFKLDKFFQGNMKMQLSYRTETSPLRVYIE